MRLIGWLLTLPIFIAVIIFVLQNRMQVSISFWPFDAEATLPVSVLSLGMLITGFIMGSVITGFSLFRSQFQIRRLRKEVDRLNTEASQKEPLSTGPTILYNGRYQPVSTVETKAPAPRKKSFWFSRKR